MRRPWFVAPISLIVVVPQSIGIPMLVGHLERCKRPSFTAAIYRFSSDDEPRKTTVGFSDMMIVDRQGLGLD
jgi:hypothetical protein